jgi:D-alanyl-lipoteichoic acid acyltransferase DltB (MBOAT superfamily)
MLFNSYTFVLIFLPLTLAGYYWLARFDHRYSAAWVAAMSVAFYGYTLVTYIPLLLISIAFNYLVGRSIAEAAAAGTAARTRRWLAFGVAVNLLLLGYYKYAGFLVGNFNTVSGAGFNVPNIVLPIGISFFTFTQIAFLVDAARGLAREYSRTHYTLFVSYFPHLIAGPILHHKEMIPQFRDPANYRYQSANFGLGLSYFAIGLIKKIALADTVAHYVAPSFNLVESGGTLSFVEAWLGALAYTLQLYFDFSGYCDMAIGLSLLFNIRLPINFNSPYKARNIVDFWRRWHMTLSRFLRDYLYIALGGNRHGATRRYINLALTMLLGGLWHGASWTFVVWGALHGAYLMINHGWQALRGSHGADTAQDGPTTARGRSGRVAAQALTLLAVIVAWVFFRAQSLDAALSMLASMSGLHGISLPVSLAPHLPASVVQSLTAVGLHFDGFGSTYAGPLPVVLIAALMGACLWLPNSQEWLEARPSANGTSAPTPRLGWAPRPLFAAALGLAAAWCILNFGRLSEFLYFQF